MAIQVSVGIENRELITSGSVIVTAPNALVFHVADLVFKINFVGTEDKKLQVDADTSNSKQLVLNFQNFDNPLGAKA